VRERLSVPPQKTEDILKQMQARGIFDERLVLSTCNRTELYGAANGRADALKLAKDFLSEYGGLELSRFEDKLYVYRGPKSVQHLFAVASGLDSMVIGETEITGQVKDAYLLAHQKQQTGKVLNTLFQKSLKVAKNLRTETRIGAGRVSVASVSVDLAEKIFESLKGVRVMVIGTGEMSTQVVKAMIARGAAARIVSSRHHDRAVALAQELGAEALAFDTYESAIQDTDILITATSAPMVLVREPQVHEWMRVRHDKPL
jgi:glutamyl-tRNA reductase